jgi:hypothetical protein
MMAVLIFLQSTISDTFRPANSVAITNTQDLKTYESFFIEQNGDQSWILYRALGGILSGISYNFLFVVNFCGAMIAGIIYVIFFKAE